jgi:hypothetical protein
LIDAIDPFFVNRIGERPGSNTVNINATVDKLARGLNGFFGGCKILKMITALIPITHKPGHGVHAAALARCPPSDTPMGHDVWMAHVDERRRRGN